MDVYVDTEEVAEGINSISATISNLESIISFMKQRLNAASENFTSINFERASVNADLATQSLSEMGEKLEITRSFLNTLVEHIEEYNKIRF